MQHARDEEDDDLRHRRRHATSNKRRVDVSTHEVGDRLVPRRPVSAYGADVPPGPVELAVTECHDLSERVERGLEEGEEAAEPAEDADGGELHDALEDGGHVQFQELVEGVLQQWGGVLGTGDPHDDAEAEDLQQVAEDEAPADVRGSWVHGLVDERWCPPEVAHVLEVDVLGVWARLVERRQWLRLPRVQVCMSQVAVREGVGRALEEDDYSVHLAECADAWVVDVEIDILGSKTEIRDCVDTVEESNGTPGRIEAFQSSSILLRCVVVLLDLCVRSLGLP